MQYIDTGARDIAQALGSWLQSELTANVTELRIQSGFFSVDGLPVFLPTLGRLAASNNPTHIVIGSNDGDTLHSHVDQLVGFLGLPRSNAKLGIVNFAGAFYHPKTYHFRRANGSQAAYVGSANLTASGVGSLHVEAGITLDTQSGDPALVLDSIAASVDDWFSRAVSGLEVVTNIADAAALAATGILSTTPPPSPPRSPIRAGGAVAISRPRLHPLIRFPGVATPGSVPAITGSPVAAAPSAAPVVIPAVPRPPFPAYVLFAPGATAPTAGAAALSGATLPGGNIGIVVRLNRDATRRWRGEGGTANVSLPIATVSTLRFGMFTGKVLRPRAEFDIEMRYLDGQRAFVAATAQTNVMVYGHEPGATGHGDVRFVIPAPPADNILQFASSNGFPLPAAGDVAFVEWPTASRSSFRVSLLDRRSPLFQTASSLFASSQQTRQLVAKNACWLPPNFSPPW